MSARVGCIGAVAIDRKVRPEGELILHTSNIVKATACPGGVIRNIAHSLALLGCPVSLYSVVGKDRAGDDLIRELEILGVDVSAVMRSGRHSTASYTAVLDDSGELFLGLADMTIFEELDIEWAEKIAPGLAECKIWVMDTNLPAVTIEHLLGRQTQGTKIIANAVSVPKSVRLRAVLDRVDVLFADQAEASALSAQPAKTPTQVAGAARTIRGLGVRTVVVTMGGEGVYFDDGSHTRRIPAIPARVARDVTGAGDALVAGYVYGMLGGREDAAILFGLAAASLTVESDKSVFENLTVECLHGRANTRALLPVKP